MFHLMKSAYVWVVPSIMQDESRKFIIDRDITSILGTIAWLSIHIEAAIFSQQIRDCFSKILCKNLEIIISLHIRSM